MLWENNGMNGRSFLCLWQEGSEKRGDALPCGTGRHTSRAEANTLSISSCIASADVADSSRFRLVRSPFPFSRPSG